MKPPRHVVMLTTSARGGVAVVSTRVGGIPDAVRDGVEGLLLEAARRRIEREFSPQAVLANLDGLYAELTARRSCAASPVS